MAKSEEKLKSLLKRVKEESEKAGSKLSIKKLRSWHPVPSLHGRMKQKLESKLLGEIAISSDMQMTPPL